MFNNLSYKIKVPLSFGLIILLTGVVITSSLLYRTSKIAQKDIVTQAYQLSEVLTYSLGNYLRHDDVWKAYKLIKTSTAHQKVPSLTPKTVIVLDKNQQVFASTDPARFPLKSPIQKKRGIFNYLNQTLSNNSLSGNIINYQKNNLLLIALSIKSNETNIGTLAIVYDLSFFEQRVFNQAMEASTVTLIILIILLPLSWFLGKQISKPLLKLTSCMSNINNVSLSEIDCNLVESKDEIGLLGRQFSLMLHELESKQELEKTVIFSERLAAIGKLVASISHEINNPLAGMLNAIDTYKIYGSNDPHAIRTFNLLERGLNQIRQTVSALIIEARSKNTPISPTDIDDILTLIEPESRTKKLQLIWKSNLSRKINLPATFVRQILLNIIINAINASPENREILCNIHVNTNELLIDVSNECENISKEKLEHLFEPLVSYNENGTGLGLWATYQIVEQLNGKISITTPFGKFHIKIILPFEDTL